jgi:hypothetical protein
VIQEVVCGDDGPLFEAACRVEWLPASRCRYCRCKGVR